MFSVKTDGSNLTDLFDSHWISNGYQDGPLTLVGNILYGMLERGGKNSSGIIYSVHTDGSGFNDLLDCDGLTGDYPNGELIMYNNTLMGITIEGGDNEDGVIFSIHPDGSKDTILYNFIGPNGANPVGDLTLSGNILYGAAQGGGTYNDGVIFKYVLPAPLPTIPNIFVPNAFSPNGDGQNDILLAKGINIKDFYMAIYDRWGEKVFETQNINEGWDGRYNGQPENAGSYIYFANGSYYDGNTFEKKGSVALIR